MGLVDGIASLEIRSSTISGTTLQASTAAFGSSEIGNAELANNAASGAKVSSEYPIGYIGSPVGGTLAFQCGSVVSSDVSVLVTFGIPFAGNPLVIITPQQSGTLVTQTFVGSTTTTGFTFWGQSGLVHSWLAINNGRV